MRELSAVVATTLQGVADEERVSIVRRRVGVLPRGGSASDELVWVSKRIAEQGLQSGKCVMRCVHNGDTTPVPLYLFDPSASPCDVIPNFDAGQTVPRRAHDPEYLINCPGYNNSAPAIIPPAHSRQVMEIIAKVTAGCSSESSNVQLITEFRDILEPEKIKKRVQVVDASQYEAREDLSHADCQLLVCLPFRNLYVSVERYHSMVLEDFCLETLKMFKALRAKTATITIRSSDKCGRQTNGWLGFLGILGGGTSSQDQADVEVDLAFSNSWGPPQSGPEDEYPLLDAEQWYYLDDSSPSCRTTFHGLDLTGARNFILTVKGNRVHGGKRIGSATIKLSFSESDKLGLSGGYKGVEGQFGRSSQTQSTVEMKLEAQMYNWNEGTNEWEWE